MLASLLVLTCAPERPSDGGQPLTGTVGPAGGAVELGDVTLTFPPGATGSGPLSFSAWLTDSLPAPVPSGDMLASRTLILRKNDDAPLKLPIEVTLPYWPASVSDGSFPIVHYWDEETKAYVPMTMLDIDESAARLTFSTTHFSSFVVLAAPFGATQQTSDFTPSRNGWAYTNFGAYACKSDYDGVCFALAATAVYYWGRGVAAYPTIDNQGTPNFLDDDLRAQELIARAACEGNGKYLAEIWGSTSRMSDEEIGQYLMSMLNKHIPVVLVMLPAPIGRPPAPIGHASVVWSYRMEDDGVRFLLYDPNRPGCEMDSASIVWRQGSDGKHLFVPYGACPESPCFRRFYALAPAEFTLGQSGYSGALRALDDGMKDEWGNTSRWAKAVPRNVTEDAGYVSASGEVTVDFRSGAKIQVGFLPGHGMNENPQYIAWRMDQDASTHVAKFDAQGLALVGPLPDTRSGDHTLQLYLSTRDETGSLPFDVCRPGTNPSCTEPVTWQGYAGYTQVKVHVCKASEDVCGDACCGAAEGDASVSPPDCAHTCGGEHVCCGESCVDLTTNPTHCGRCDTKCDDGQVCAGGQCLVTCTSFGAQSREVSGVPASFEYSASCSGHAYDLDCEGCLNENGAVCSCTEDGAQTSIAPVVSCGGFKVNNPNQVASWALNNLCGYPIKPVRTDTSTYSLYCGVHVYEASCTSCSAAPKCTCYKDGQATGDAPGVTCDSLDVPVLVDVCGFPVQSCAHL